MARRQRVEFWTSDGEYVSFLAGKKKKGRRRDIWDYYWGR